MFSVYQNSIKFIINIGYSIESKSLDEKSYIKELDFSGYSIIKASKDSKGLYFIIVSPNSVSTSKSAEFAKIINKIKGKNNRLIVVSENGLKSGVIKSITTKYKEKISSFQEHKHILFKIDPRNNVIVPRHTICDEKEREKVLKDNGLDDVSHFPKIIYNKDPQAIWLDAQVGDLIRIERFSSVGCSVAYRVCVVE